MTHRSVLRFGIHISGNAVTKVEYNSEWQYRATATLGLSVHL